MSHFFSVSLSLSVARSLALPFAASPFLFCYWLTTIYLLISCYLIVSFSFVYSNISLLFYPKSSGHYPRNKSNENTFDITPFCFNLCAAKAFGKRRCAFFFFSFFPFCLLIHHYIIVVLAFACFRCFYIFPCRLFSQGERERRCNWMNRDSNVNFHWTRSQMFLGKTIWK